MHLNFYFTSKMLQYYPELSSVKKWAMVYRSPILPLLRSMKEVSCVKYRSSELDGTGVREDDKHTEWLRTTAYGERVQLWSCKIYRDVYHGLTVTVMMATQHEYCSRAARQAFMVVRRYTYRDVAWLIAKMVYQMYADDWDKVIGT